MDTDSINIKYYKDKTNPLVTTYSIVQILQVLIPSTWRDNPGKS